MPTSTGLNRTLRAFIARQTMFFVATATEDSRVNLSPKGMDSLRILSDNRIIWLNVSGSGNETAAHLQENSRMTLMFCAFDGPAGIVRTYGSARTILPEDRDWDTLVSQFPQMAGSRQIFDLNIDLVQVSCGTGVPQMDFIQQRGPAELLPFFAEMGEDGVRNYWKKKNSISIDGKPTGN